MRLTLAKFSLGLFALGFLSTEIGKADIVYTGVRTAGTATANLSITTDGTIGTLSTGNILDYTIQIVDGATSFTLTGPLSGNNSAYIVAGSALTATSTGLFFNFDQPGGNAMAMQAPFLGSSRTYYCAATPGACGGAGGDYLNATQSFASGQFAAQVGLVQLASAASTSVPEPSEAVLYVSGVALAFRQLRRRAAVRR